MFKFADIKKTFFVVLCLMAFCPDNSLLANDLVAPSTIVQFQAFKSDTLFYYQKIERARFNEDSLEIYKERAIFGARNGSVKMAKENVELYIKYSSDVGFIDSRYFKEFKDTKEFVELSEKYSVSFSWLHFFYLFASIIGFFIVILNFLKKPKDLVATILMSLFVLINSVFIFLIFIYVTNLKFRAPHSLYVSAITIYLYGPLAYFYFKRVTLNYKLRKVDLLHLLPTVIILLILVPIYALPSQDKINIMLDVGTFKKDLYLKLMVLTKIVSLLIYGILLLRLYFKNKKKLLAFSKTSQKWMFTIMVFVEFYVFTYLIYGLIIIDVLPRNEFVYNLQISIIAVMVLYIGYISYLKPNLFEVERIAPSKGKKKYTKSSLTPSYSIELKEKLIYLLETDKIYKQNDLSLEYLSEKLDTTRHNTSQVINENFNVSFFELINTYRIEEALEIIKNDTDSSLNIIEVAYAVGFNNKVSFNKSFKKHLSQTPSQFIGELRLK